MEQEKKQTIEADNSLESVDASTSPEPGKEIDASKADAKDGKDGKKDDKKSGDPKGSFISRILSHVNVYFLLFLFILLLTAIIIF
jgi:hypothetical protein